MSRPVRALAQRSLLVPGWLQGGGSSRVGIVLCVCGRGWTHIHLPTCTAPHPHPAHLLPSTAPAALPPHTPYPQPPSCLYRHPPPVPPLCLHQHPHWAHYVPAGGEQAEQRSTRSVRVCILLLVREGTGWGGVGCGTGGKHHAALHLGSCRRVVQKARRWAALRSHAAALQCLLACRPAPWSAGRACGLVSPPQRAAACTCKLPLGC